MATIGAIFIASGVSILFTAVIYGVNDWNNSCGAESSRQIKKPCGTR